MNHELIKDAIYHYGVYPALCVLREEQENENYENCALIKSALDEICEGREWYVSSAVDDDNMSQTLRNILNGRSSDCVIVRNMPHYIEQFKKHVHAG